MKISGVSRSGDVQSLEVLPTSRGTLFVFFDLGGETLDTIVVATEVLNSILRNRGTQVIAGVSGGKMNIELLGNEVFLAVTGVDAVVGLDSLMGALAITSA